MVAAGVTLHYAFAATGVLPIARPEFRTSCGSSGLTLVLNALFLWVAVIPVFLHMRGRSEPVIQAVVA